MASFGKRSTIYFVKQGVKGYLNPILHTGVAPLSMLSFSIKYKLSLKNHDIQHQMTNNDVLRSLRYILHVNETKLIEIIGLADFRVSKDDVISFLKQEEEPGYKNCGDKVLAHFLNGLIVYKRGKDESKPSLPIEVSMTNNIILKKLRVAFQLKDSDIIRLIEKSGLKISKTELSAFFRSPDHRNYRDCGNQFLRNLLRGLAS